MDQDSTVVGLDVHKDTIAAAVLAHGAPQPREVVTIESSPGARPSRGKSGRAFWAWRRGRGREYLRGHYVAQPANTHESVNALSSSMPWQAAMKTW